MLLCCLIFLVALAQAGIVTYPRPSIYNASSLFNLTVNGTPINTVSYHGYDYAQLSMDQDALHEYVVTLRDGSPITSYTISPRRLDISGSATVSGSSLKFHIKMAYYLIVRINEEQEFVIMTDPLETDVPASSGPGIYNVKDYDADGTGSAITKGVQNALDAAGKAPGGIVYVPEGVYMVGNLVIPSNTALYLASGSVLRFTGNPADYKQIFNKPGMGSGTWWIQTAVGSRNCKVYGRGTIDANGYDYQKGKHVAHIIVPVGTDNFTYDGPVIRESPFWTIVPTQSSNVKLTNVKILNRMDMIQNDGIDVVESTNVLTERAIAIANDDAYSTKTWGTDPNDIFAAYPYPPRPLSDVTFTNCFAWTHCYGFKVGQGVSEDQTNVTFRQGDVYSASVGLGVHHKYGTGVSKGVTWSDIIIERLHGVIPPGTGTWMAIFIEDGGTRGIGPVEDSLVENIRLYSLGDKDAWVKGFNSSYLVSHTHIVDIYVNDSTTPITDMSDLRIYHSNSFDTTLTGS